MLLKIMRPPFPLVYLFHILLPFKKCWLLCLLFILINNHFLVTHFLFHLFFFSSSVFLLWHFNASDLFQHIMKTSSAFSWFPHFWVLWQRMLVDLVKRENVTLLFILWWMHIHEYSSMQKQLQAVLKGPKPKSPLNDFLRCCIQSKTWQPNPSTQKINFLSVRIISNPHKYFFMKNYDFCK